MVREGSGDRFTQSAGEPTQGTYPGSIAGRRRTGRGPHELLGVVHVATTDVTHGCRQLWQSRLCPTGASPTPPSGTVPAAPPSRTPGPNALGLKPTHRNPAAAKSAACLAGAPRSDRPSRQRSLLRNPARFDPEARGTARSSGALDVPVQPPARHAPGESRPRKSDNHHTLRRCSNTRTRTNWRRHNTACLGSHNRCKRRPHSANNQSVLVQSTSSNRAG
jgi:hypothetical protein